MRILRSLLLAALCCLSVNASSDEKEWSVLMYCNANGLGTQMLNSFAQAATRVRDKTTTALVHCQYGRGHAWRFKLSDEAIKIKDHIQWVDTFNADNPVVEAFTDLKKNYPAKHYAVILMGFGSGNVDLVWSWEENHWVWPTERQHRGLLYDPENNFQLSTAQFINTCRRIHEDVLVDKKLDLVITDACAMNSVEMLGSLAADVEYFCGTQDEQPLDGLPYDKVFNVLNMRDVTPAGFASGIVDAFNDYYRMNGPGHAISYSATNASRVPMLRDALFEFVGVVQDEIDRGNETFKTLVYSARDAAVESLGYPEYIDAFAWAQSLADIVADNSSIVSSDTVRDARNVMVRIRDMFYRYGSDERADNSVITNHCSLMRELPTHGLTLYYPRTWVHPDHQGSHDAWTRFLAGSTAHLAVE